MLRALLLTPLLAGCASVPRTDCKHSVFLRAGVEQFPPLMCCPEAVAAVARYRPPLREPWTVEFAPGPIYTLGVDGKVHEAFAVTHPATRTIVCNADDPWALKHEFLHAQDVEAGRPNTRD